VGLEEDGGDQLDQSREKRTSVTQILGVEEYPTYSTTKEG